MKKMWKQLLAAYCATAMLMTMPGMCVLADEMQEEEVIVTEAEVPKEAVESVDSSDEDVADDSDASIAEENIGEEEAEEIVGEGPIQVGDGVTATFDADTGAVEFVSQDGELWPDWVDKLGVSRGKITSIKVASGTVYLPADSSGYNESDKSYQMFGGLAVLGSIDMSSFNTSNVENMSHMFFKCYSLTGSDFSSMDTAKVSNMEYMFAYCEGLYELDLSSFDTSNVTDMSCMFAGCDKLEVLNVGNFDTSNVANMSYMFWGCEELEDLNVGNFDTSNVTDMSYMFADGPELAESTELAEPTLKNFDTSNVTDMSNMFAGNSNWQWVDLSSFDTSKVTNMSCMFHFSQCGADVSGFDTSNVTDMSYMFSYAFRFYTLDVSNFATSKVTDMSGMFSYNTRISELDVSNFDTSNVTDMSYMFAYSSIISLDLSRFDTKKVTNMSDMFAGCTDLAYLDLSGLNTSNVTDMSEMFWDCYNLTSLNLSSFNTEKVNSMYLMFDNCSSLTRLDLSSFDVSNTFGYEYILDDCNELQLLKTPKKMSNSSGQMNLPFVMYDQSGKEYTVLSNLSKSITLTREKPSTPVPTPTPTPTVTGFSDVQDPSHPYYKAIYWAAGEGITKGYSDGTFGINRSCTRGEMMMFLWKYAKKPAPKTASKSPFKDVPTSHAFYKAILWGYQKGITKGYSDGTFGINRNVSRGEAMMFLWKLKGKPAPTTVSKSPFKDVPTSHAFYKAILWGSQNGITKGYTTGPDKGKFGINDNCTRGQIVTFLYRAKDK